MANTVSIKNPITTAVVELAEVIESYEPLSSALAASGEELAVKTLWQSDGEFVEPSVTILTPSSRLVRHFPFEELWDINVDGPKNAALRTGRYRIGDITINMDLHIYANSLKQRGLVEAGLINLLEASTTFEDFPNTLRIQSSEYYSEILRYHLFSNFHNQGEDLSKQSQYISILSVVCDMRWIISQQEYEITSIHLHTQSSLEDLLNQQIDEEVIIVS